MNENRMGQISFKCQYSNLIGSIWAYVIEIDGFCFPNLSIWFIIAFRFKHNIYSWIDVQIRAYSVSCINEHRYNLASQISPTIFGESVLQWRWMVSGLVWFAFTFSLPIICFSTSNLNINVMIAFIVWRSIIDSCNEW